MISLEKSLDLNQAMKMTVIILRHILKNMKAKFSIQTGHFWRFFYPMFANCVHATLASIFTLLNLKSSFDQFVASLP